ncbi:MAG: hypothetical protein GY845_35460 [Planctomycetes bacterium]|nr:hypothetical protein [Planctomycetota bacterium]
MSNQDWKSDIEKALGDQQKQELMAQHLRDLTIHLKAIQDGHGILTQLATKADARTCALARKQEQQPLESREKLKSILDMMGDQYTFYLNVLRDYEDQFERPLAIYATIKKRKDDAAALATQRSQQLKLEKEARAKAHLEEQQKKMTVLMMQEEKNSNLRRMRKRKRSSKKVKEEESDNEDENIHTFVEMNEIGAMSDVLPLPEE